MTDKQFVLTTMRDTGLARAQTLQAQAPEMTGTELYASGDYIPSFTAACGAMNMLEREAGFVCCSTAGRVVRLLQPYDSAIYNTQEPEDLPRTVGLCMVHRPGQGPAVYRRLHFAVYDRGLLHL